MWSVASLQLPNVFGKFGLVLVFDVVDGTKGRKKTRKGRNKNILNKRSELFSKCRHVTKHTVAGSEFGHSYVPFFMGQSLIKTATSRWLETDLCIIYRVYQKKGNRNLQCSSAFIIQSTEIILSQAERPGF